MPFCTRCGGVVAEDARFCRSCGLGVDETALTPKDGARPPDGFKGPTVAVGPVAAPSAPTDPAREEWSEAGDIAWTTRPAVVGMVVWALALTVGVDRCIYLWAEGESKFPIFVVFLAIPYLWLWRLHRGGSIALQLFFVVGALGVLISFSQLSRIYEAATHGPSAMRSVFWLDFCAGLATVLLTAFGIWRFSRPDVLLWYGRLCPHCGSAKSRRSFFETTATCKDCSRHWRLGARHAPASASSTLPRS